MSGAFGPGRGPGRGWGRGKLGRGKAPGRGRGKLGAYLSTPVRAKRNRTDLLRFLVRRPALLAAVGTYETALLASGAADNRLKALAQIKASSLVGCPF